MIALETYRQFITENRPDIELPRIGQAVSELKLWELKSQKLRNRQFSGQRPPNGCVWPEITSSWRWMFNTIPPADDMAKANVFAFEQDISSLYDIKFSGLYYHPFHQYWLEIRTLGGVLMIYVDAINHSWYFWRWGITTDPDGKNPKRGPTDLILKVQQDENDGCKFELAPYFANIEQSGNTVIVDPRVYVEDMISALIVLSGKPDSIAQDDPIPKVHRRLMQAKGVCGRTYKMLPIDISSFRKTNCNNQGGTHASPRTHERRGHWRCLLSGKKVWVRNSIINFWKSDGEIIKDYIVRNQDLEEIQ